MADRVCAIRAKGCNWCISPRRVRRAFMRIDRSEAHHCGVRRCTHLSGLLAELGERRVCFSMLRIFMIHDHDFELFAEGLRYVLPGSPVCGAFKSVYTLSRGSIRLLCFTRVPYGQWTTCKPTELVGFLNCEDCCEGICICKVERRHHKGNQAALTPRRRIALQGCPYRQSCS
jgi:hypothetical protein